MKDLDERGLNVVGWAGGRIQVWDVILNIASSVNGVHLC